MAGGLLGPGRRVVGVWDAREGGGLRLWSGISEGVEGLGRSARRVVRGVKAKVRNRGKVDRRVRNAARTHANSG